MATPDRIIPQRELRNNVGGVLRDVQAGARLRVTVRGKPVADLVPADEADERRRFLTVAEVRRLLSETPVDAGFARDIDELLEQHVDEH